jgi:tetratricopeptide (TPR) repeat protein
MPQRRWLLPVLLCALLSASPAFGQVSAAANPAPPAAPVKELVDAVERGRLALLAEHPAEAASEFEKVLRMPQFGELQAAAQMEIFQFAAIAASALKDNLGAHEFMVLATDSPEAGAQYWVLRALYAGWAEDWGDAGIAYATVAKRWPESLSLIEPRVIALTAIRMNKDARHTKERLDLLDALFAANFKLEYGVEPAELWRDLVQDALEHNNLERARALSVRVTDPATLIEMRVDRRFDALTQGDKARFDVRAAAEREYRRLKSLSAENPRMLSPLVQQTYSMLEIGRFKEIVKIADEVFERVVQAKGDTPAYEDIDEKLNWIYDNKFRALRALGRWDEALAVLEAGSRRLEGGSANVSQAINLGNYLLALGRPEKALTAMEAIDWGNSLNSYGRMEMQYVRYRAFLQSGNAKEAEKVFAYLREHRGDAEDTWQAAVLDSGDFDAAAARFIWRLRDPEGRASALASAQDFASAPSTPTEAVSKMRWSKLLTRADVAAAIEEVGRREKFSTYSIGF